MTSLEQEDMIEFENPENFKEKITGLQDKLPFILEDFKKNYVLYNKDQEYNEYQQTFEVSKGNLQQINFDLSTIETDVSANTNKLNEQLNEINRQIEEEREENIMLKSKLGLLEDGSNSMDEMIDDYKKKYHLAYLRNWGLLLSTLVAWITIKYIFKSFQVKLDYTK
jgi:uncharacterized protein YqgV (UPF0045/DUF77 family)